MTQRRYKVRALAACILGSILLHLVPGIALSLLGTYHFGSPVQAPPAVMVDLAGSKEVAAAPSRPAEPPQGPAEPERERASAGEPPVPEEPAASAAEPAAEPAAAALPVPEPRPAAEPPRAPAAGAAVGPTTPESVASRAPASAPAAAEPARLKSSDFLAARYEKLSYLITMRGFPIGTAELEAACEKGATTITLRVRSNSAVSNIYPVDNVVETRHIDGKFIMTKIRQQEGSFRSDEMFTINLGKKRVSWVDFLQGRSLKTTVPTGEVLDTLSGIYYLRNRPLQVGQTQTLHIFDSESYAEVPVEILRREELRLPNLAKVATLVIRPLQKTSGIFRRTGDLLVWMTDDDRKVPVRIVTTIALGKVTADLVSAETRLPEKEQASAPAVPSRWNTDIGTLFVTKN